MLTFLLYDRRFVCVCVLSIYLWLLSNYLIFYKKKSLSSTLTPCEKEWMAIVDVFVDNKTVSHTHNLIRMNKIFFTLMMMNLKRVETCSPTEPKSNYVTRLDTNGSVVVVEKFPVTFRGYTYGTFSFRLVVTRRLLIDSIANRGSSCIPKRNEESSASSGFPELCW